MSEKSFSVGDWVRVVRVINDAEDKAKELLIGTIFVIQKIWPSVPKFAYELKSVGWCFDADELELVYKTVVPGTPKIGDFVRVLGSREFQQVDAVTVLVTHKHEKTGKPVQSEFFEFVSKELVAQRDKERLLKERDEMWAKSKAALEELQHINERLSHIDDQLKQIN